MAPGRVFVAERAAYRIDDPERVGRPAGLRNLGNRFQQRGTPCKVGRHPRSSFVGNRGRCLNRATRTKRNHGRPERRRDVERAERVVRRADTAHGDVSVEQFALGQNGGRGPHRTRFVGCERNRVVARDVAHEASVVCHRDHTDAWFCGGDVHARASRVVHDRAPQRIIRPVQSRKRAADRRRRAAGSYVRGPASTERVSSRDRDVPHRLHGAVVARVGLHRKRRRNGMRSARDVADAVENRTLHVRRQAGW